MLVPLGKRQEQVDVVGLLLECHERIRRFLTMTRDLSHAHEAAPEEIRTVAAQIRRYFVESLPLHIADEEEQILPRIRNQNVEVDRALASMTDDHAAHVAWLDQLTAVCDCLVSEPARIAELAPELARLGDVLTADLGRHLELEEQVIFPALRRLGERDKAEILAAMRERRARALQ